MEALAKGTKRQSAEYRDRDAQAMATKRGKATKHQSSEYREIEAQVKNAISDRGLSPAASYKLLKHSLQLLKKGQITRVSAAIT